MTVLTIIVVAILTALIFALAILAYQTTYSSARKEMAKGVYDIDPKDFSGRGRCKAKMIIANSFSVAICVALIALAAASITYRATGNQVEINGKTSLVIASDSMSGFYDDDYEAELLEYRPTAGDEHFDVGDILTFERIAEGDQLVPYDVYGYASKGKIIVHRYIPHMDSGGKIAFRGDNAAGRDSLVGRSAVIYHWTGGKIAYVGTFILFGQSWLGLYSCIGVACVFAISDIYAAKFRKAEREYAKAKAEQDKKDRSAEIYANYVAAQKRRERDEERRESAAPDPKIGASNGRKIKKRIHDVVRQAGCDIREGEAR
jgi:hypothetical protein